MRLIKALTKKQHIALLTEYTNDITAAQVYTDAIGCPVTRQNVQYWRKIFIKHGSKAKADADTAQARVLRRPGPEDDINPSARLPFSADRILVIGDLHAPYHHPDTLAFLQHVKNLYAPDCVVQIGDETDGHAISFHESDPNLDSAGMELERAKIFLEDMHRLFPSVLVCHSNHGSLVYRRAKHAGLPVQMIKSYREILFPEHEAPGWNWRESWTLNTVRGPVLFKHQSAGPVLGDAAHEGMSLVVGHEHGKFGVEYGASTSRLYYGAHTGCLIDKDALAFAYGKGFKLKPIIGCLMIIDGIPTPIPMPLNHHGRWTHG